MGEMYDMIIVGGGPAGLSAAYSAWQNGAKRILVLERDREVGGILQQCIHNGFGLHHFKEELTGPGYAHRCCELVKDKPEIEILVDTMVLEVRRDKTVLAVNPQRGVMELAARTVVLTMGCRERTRGAIRIPGYRPAGVYTAGAAQRMVNMEGYLPGHKIVILGSGDIGLIMARRMTWEGAKVELVAEIMPYSSGLNRNIVQCLFDNDIPLKFNHTVTKIHGRERVEGVTVSQVDPATRLPIPGTEFFVECDTLLLSVGLIPENELSRAAGIAMDGVTGGATVNEARETSVPGVFACGNVLHVHDLVDNVSNEAAIAGAAAARYAAGEARTGMTYSVTGENGVRYALPQRISSGVSGSIDVYFRVVAVYRDATVEVSCGGEKIFSRRRQILTPGEMEKIALDASKITGDVVVRLNA